MYDTTSYDYELLERENYRKHISILLEGLFFSLNMGHSRVLTRE